MRGGDGQVHRVHQERRPGRLDDGARGHDVVEVGMAGHDARDRDTHIPGQLQDLLGLVARIDHARLAAFAAANDPAVLAEETDDDTADLQLDGAAAHRTEGIQFVRPTRWSSTR